MLYIKTMVKKSKEMIKSKILEVLNDKPLSINKISTEVGSNWSTINELLKILKEENKVREIVTTDKIRVFKLLREDTYFDLPIDKKEREICYYFFDKIRNIWFDIKKKLIGKIEMQKILTDIVEELPSIHILKGLYLFGGMTVLKFDPSQQYSSQFKPKSEHEIEELIRSTIIKDYHDCKNVKQTMMNYYKKKNLSLYLIKEEINSIFTGNLNLDKEKFTDLLSDFLFYSPIKEDASQIVEIISEFVSLTIKLIKKCPKLEEIKYQIFETYNSIWLLVATYNFFDSLTEDTRYRDRREEIYEFYFYSKIKDRIQSSIEYLSHLDDILSRYSDISSETKLQLDNKTKMIRDSFVDMARVRK